MHAPCTILHGPQILLKLTPVADAINLFFSVFFFGVKLGHFAINYCLYVANTQAYQQKTEKFFVSEEKKFNRIGYRSQFYQTSRVNLILMAKSTKFGRNGSGSQ
jgi:hypothetical protein